MNGGMSHRLQYLNSKSCKIFFATWTQITSLLDAGLMPLGLNCVWHAQKCPALPKQTCNRYRSEGQFNGALEHRAPCKERENAVQTCSSPFQHDCLTTAANVQERGSTCAMQSHCCHGGSGSAVPKRAGTLDEPHVSAAV